MTATTMMIESDVNLQTNIWPWNLHETGHASLIHPGAACIDYHTNRSDRTSKEADESPFFSPSAKIDICIPHRASACLSCLFYTVVEIVTDIVCVWNNRRYAKHHPDGLYVPQKCSHLGQMKFVAALSDCPKYLTQYTAFHVFDG